MASGPSVWSVPLASSSKSVQPIVDSIAASIGRGESVIVPVDPVADNPSAIAILHACSAALLVVRLGESQFTTAQNTIDIVDRERFLGSIVLEQRRPSICWRDGRTHGCWNFSWRPPTIVRPGLRPVKRLDGDVPDCRRALEGPLLCCVRMRRLEGSAHRGAGGALLPALFPAVRGSCRHLAVGRERVAQSVAHSRHCVARVVPPGAARGRRRSARPQSGLVLVIGSLLVLLVGTAGVEFFLMRVSAIGVIVGGVLFLAGWGWLRVLLFPLALTALVIPIPPVIFYQLTFPLQVLATKFGVGALQLLGIPVFREGNVISLAHTTLEVTEACSGIRSLLSLFTLAVLYGYFTDPRLGARVAIALSSIPIAIIANGLRIAGTGVAAHYISPSMATGFFHAFSGWTMFLTSASC